MTSPSLRPTAAKLTKPREAGVGLLVETGEDAGAGVAAGVGVAEVVGVGVGVVVGVVVPPPPPPPPLLPGVLPLSQPVELGVTVTTLVVEEVITRRDSVEEQIKV